jgi:hypothetical protein
MKHSLFFKSSQVLSTFLRFPTRQTPKDWCASAAVVCISFWTLREDFERYNREHYYTIADTLQPLLESPVTQETFEVNASTAHGIAVGKAT